MKQQLRVGLVGTGYAAKLRAEALRADPRANWVAIAGQDPQRTRTFAQPFGVIVEADWRSLIARSDLDLIVIATINRDHGPIAAAALQAGKHVVVEYPLSLDLAQAEALVSLAQAKGLLLHVEHIEILGGLHQSLLENLERIGTPHHVRYATIAPKSPAPRRWSFHYQDLGFPLVAALSRVHRLTHAFGPVASVSCQAKFWSAPDDPNYFLSCLCNAQLFFTSGVLGTLTYGKGEAFWRAERLFEVSGDRGALRFEQDQGVFLSHDGEIPLEVGGKRGLFAKDTAMVLDYLGSSATMSQTEMSQAEINQADRPPLYVSITESLYALRVADAMRRAAETGQTIPVIA